MNNDNGQELVNRRNTPVIFEAIRRLEREILDLKMENRQLHERLSMQTAELGAISSAISLLRAERSGHGPTARD